MLFDELLKQARAAGRLTVPASWAQGRTVYGGLSAALLCDAMSRETQRPLRYLKTGFLKPLEVEKPFQIRMEEVSGGRTLQVRTAEIIQEGTVRVTSQAHFVAPLESKIEIETFSAPRLENVGSPHTVPLRNDETPAFLRYFDNHVATAGLPFRGHAISELGGWMRFRDPPRQWSASHLVCAIDAWPPAPAPHLEKPANMSTISWGIHFAEPVDGLDPAAFIAYLARVNFFRDGFGSSTADVWDPSGRLLAKSYQTFVIYA